MNCHQFNKKLYDYLDGTLSFDRAADAREHLTNCLPCQHALEQEQATARFLNDSLHQATADLSLNRWAALIAPTNYKPRPDNFGQFIWRWLTADALRPIGMGAALLLIIAACFIWQRMRMDSISHRARQAQVAVVDVPIVSISHVFQRQNGTVVDAIGSTFAMAHAGPAAATTIKN